MDSEGCFQLQCRVHVLILLVHDVDVVSDVLFSFYMVQQVYGGVGWVRFESDGVCPHMDMGYIVNKGSSWGARSYEPDRFLSR